MTEGCSWPVDHLQLRGREGDFETTDLLDPVCHLWCTASAFVGTGNAAGERASERRRRNALVCAGAELNENGVRVK